MYDKIDRLDKISKLTLPVITLTNNNIHFCLFLYPVKTLPNNNINWNHIKFCLFLFVIVCFCLFLFVFVSSKNIGTTAKDSRQATAILDRNSAIDSIEMTNLKLDKSK